MATICLLLGIIVVLLALQQHRCGLANHARPGRNAHRLHPRLSISQRGRIQAPTNKVAVDLVSTALLFLWFNGWVFIREGPLGVGLNPDDEIPDPWKVEYGRDL